MSMNVSSAAEAAAYAMKDLAAKLGVSLDHITLAESAEATWPDASLGIPEPGKMYAQMLTEGFRVLLKAGGSSYEYHFGNGAVRTQQDK